MAPLASTPVPRHRAVAVSAAQTHVGGSPPPAKQERPGGVPPRRQRDAARPPASGRPATPRRPSEQRDRTRRAAAKTPAAAGSATRDQRRPGSGRGGAGDRAAPAPDTQRPPPAYAPGAEQGVPATTLVPRAPSIQDGPWGKQDSQLVLTSQQDADLAASPARVDAEGFVLLGKTVEELRAFAQQHRQQPFRGQQLLDGILQGARTLDDVANVPAAWREELKAAGVRTGRSIVHDTRRSDDGTAKLLLQLQDGRLVEAVGIPCERRLTVCVSSQVGCPMRCSFCATGKGGFARNLSPHEVLDQVLTVQELFGRRASNVVFMGMGEPLLNMRSVVATCQLLNQQLGISGRNITVSTVGVPNAITRLAERQLPATLAVSIHAPNQALRERLIPSARVFPLDALISECVTYFKQTGRRVSFEYTLLKGVNDEPAHATELGLLLKKQRMPTHVNLIPWNPVDESEYKRPSPRRVTAFKAALEAVNGPTISIRTTRGLEAAAACGQLRNEHQKTPLSAFSLPA